MKATFISFALFALSFSISAQNKSVDHPRASLENMQNLNLTADQSAQMKALSSDMRTQMKAIREDSSLTEDQRKEKMKDLMATRRDKLNAILTPQQEATLKKEMANRKGSASKDGRKGQGQNSMADLNLTPDQKSKMESLRKKSNSKIEVIRQDQKNQIESILTPEQKAIWDKKMADRKSKYESNGKNARKAQQKKYASDLNLTPDQKQKMKELRENTRTQIKAVRDDNSLTNDQKKAESRKILAKQKQGALKLLTPEQKVIWQKDRAASKDKNSKNDRNKKKNS